MTAFHRRPVTLLMPWLFCIKTQKQALPVRQDGMLPVAATLRGGRSSTVGPKTASILMIPTIPIP